MQKNIDKLMEKKFSRDRFFISYGLRKQFEKKVIRIIFIVIFAILFVSFIFSFLIYPVSEKSNSMSPNIIQNSILFVTPIKTVINRGDVVLIDNQKNDFSVTKIVLEKLIRFFTFQRLGFDKIEDEVSSKKSLKRVIGLPGDTIYMKDFMVYIKPKNEKHFYTEFELTKKNYDLEIFNLPKNWDTEIGLKSDFQMIVLGEREYFVLADNRFSSFDSRYWGVLKKSELVAKALFLYFPFSNARIF